VVAREIFCKPKTKKDEMYDPDLIEELEEVF
jgi:hypothetical protein